MRCRSRRQRQGREDPPDCHRIASGPNKFGAPRRLRARPGNRRRSGHPIPNAGRVLTRPMCHIGHLSTASGRYGVGMLFLPPEDEAESKCRNLVERVISDEGLELSDGGTYPPTRRKSGRMPGQFAPGSGRCSSPRETWTGSGLNGSST